MNGDWKHQEQEECLESSAYLPFDDDDTVLDCKEEDF
jgi:hypothetical protein